MIMPKPGEARQATMKTMVIPAPKTGMPVSTFLLLVFVNDLVTAEVGRFFRVPRGVLNTRKYAKKPRSLIACRQTIKSHSIHEIFSFIRFGFCCRPVYAEAV